jgi:hypothetical protein
MSNTYLFELGAEVFRWAHKLGAGGVISARGGVGSSNYFGICD